MALAFVIGNPNGKVRAAFNQIVFDSSTFTYYQQKSSPDGSIWEPYLIPVNGVTLNASGDGKNILKDDGQYRRVEDIITEDSIPFTSLTRKPTTLQGYGITDAIAISNTILNVAGSVSGAVDFAQPFRSPAYKRVTIYMRALVGTASYTFPVPFTHAPQILSDSAPRIATVTLLSATAVTITGAGQTGFIELNGF